MLNILSFKAMLNILSSSMECGIFALTKLRSLLECKSTSLIAKIGNKLLTGTVARTVRLRKVRAFHSSGGDHCEVRESVLNPLRTAARVSTWQASTPFHYS